MQKTASYKEKFAKISGNTTLLTLSSEHQDFIEKLAFTLRFTQQELRQIVEIQRDLSMWGEDDLSAFFKLRKIDISDFTPDKKKEVLTFLFEHVNSLRHSAKTYPQDGLKRPKKREKSKITQVESEKKIHGMCPVASPRTVCCNLRTIDAVENCVFGCSYCTIQTFYSPQVTFDKGIKEKLRAIELDPEKKYHFGTGQSSDSLAWGDRFDNLQALCGWAADNPNILLEFKTKSDNVQYFVENEVPPNILCTWSLNPETIIQNEEHFTASLKKRLSAARLVADQGIKVGFHFHPMIYYAAWEIDYPAIVTNLLQSFDPEEILFISMGSVTFIKPVIKKIRNLGLPSKILQMPLVPDPHGKYTYNDDIKVAMFRRQFAAFAQWHDKVFFYLCMEKDAIWQRTFGSAYATNAEFEEDMLQSCFRKIDKSTTDAKLI
ncbi:MAG: hypothetical protein DWQ05_09375 [Calditrichaeota bacterium]|nr:MAG: hypothetical protein DWQ05_09375 [Calditrichota bacterium]